MFSVYECWLFAQSAQFADKATDFRAVNDRVKTTGSGLGRAEFEGTKVDPPAPLTTPFISFLFQNWGH